MGGITPTMKGYAEGTDSVSPNNFSGTPSSGQMQLDPTQRRFLPFNDLPANMYGPVTTGNTYEDSQFFVKPYVAPYVPPVVTDPPIVVTTTPTDTSGNDAPYIGVDIYDSEGDNNFLTEDEIASKVKIIQDVIGDPNYNPNTDVLTEEQQDLVNNQTITLDGDPNTDEYADSAKIAMDDIYNNNQQIYGTNTGNNVTSLVTGQNTGTPAPWVPPGYEVGPNGNWIEAGPAQTSAQIVAQAEQASSAATSEWAKATQVANSISPSDDPAEWHAAIQAQSAASKAATQAAKAATEARNNDDDPSNDGNSSACFLTTAIVGRRGEADDGLTLTKLRNFRDTYMSKIPSDIEEYYSVAPKIVKSIPSDHKDWDWIESQIDKSVEFIDRNLLDKAYKTYKDMVKKLEKDWL